MMDTHEHHKPEKDEAATEPIEIVASIAKQVTFATHQNDVPVIADLSLRNLRNEYLENLELVLECEPAVIGSKVWQIDRIAPKGELHLSDRAVPLSGAMLSNLNERLRAELRLMVRKDNTVLAEERRELIGLAHNEWGGADHMPELLAAFVMPNDPAVGKILKEAGEVLRRAGQQPALDGYQSRSRQRVWQIASAIWSAVSGRRLVYVEPPASFEQKGQKIRTPSEVLESGLATCLDTTVLFAAALEQSGLNPIIALTKGHSLCGVWLQPQELPSLTADDCTDLRKYEALKELALFETTMAISEPPAKLTKALEEGKRRISEPLEGDFIYALDIRRARRQQITPLGLVVENDKAKSSNGGQTVVLPLEDAPDLPGFDFDLDDGKRPDTPETRLDHWKRKLLDLTKRNRLLNLKPSKTAISMLCPDPAALEDKLADNKKITVIPLVKLSARTEERDAELFHHRTGEDFAKRFAADALERNEIVSDIEQKDLDAGLIQLFRKARSDLQEGGANTLYLALGLLKWKQSEQEQRSYRAPLILVPVKLDRRSAASKVKIVHHEDEPVFNMTLLEMLRQDFDLRIPELEGELPKDESGVDVALIWEIARKAVRDVPGFEVVEDVVLSTFSFAKYLMWKDLADRTEILKQSPFVHHLIDHPREPYGDSAEIMRPEEIDERIDPSELFMPLPADSSQIVAVHASSQGGDFVLEGPPGTGKSQTIANIIAHNLALGRRVLFVSEKMAALEVVYRRLLDKGLGTYCLELHSKKANKRMVLDQLGRSWRGRHARASDEWKVEAARLKALRDDLNGLVKALHSPGVTGVSPRAAIGRAVRWQNVHRLRLDWQGGLEADSAKDAEGLQRLEEIVARLGQTFGEIGESEHNAFANLHQTDWSNAWQARYVEASKRLIEAIDRLLSASRRLASETGLPDPDNSLPHLIGLLTIATKLPVAARRNLGFGLSANGASLLDDLQKALAALEAYNKEIKTLSCTYPDAAIADAPIEAWKEQWAKASNAVWPLGPFRRWRFSAQLRKSCQLGIRPRVGEDLPHLEALKSLRGEMDEVAFELPGEAPWLGLDTDVRKTRECLEAARILREGVARLVKVPGDLPQTREALRRLCVEGQELLQAGMPVAEAAQGLVEAVGHFQVTMTAYCREANIENDKITDLAMLREQAQAAIDLQPRINTWCRWQTVRREAEASDLSAVVAALENGVIEASASEETFKTAYCVWLAGRIVDTRPELRTFSALTHEEKIKTFRALDQKMADLSVDYIRAKLSGDIPDPTDPDRPVAYGVLARELQKKMRHKPVRQLVSELGEVLTTLTPCLLMSPLSVAQFLSADSKPFDLVVFDEASQITIWDAIGAIARGSNVIVVGDPKQMPPTSFFERAASEDEGEDAGFADDLESILDEALAASIKWHRLTGHYRSKHESLIAFSNHRYYTGDLVTYPSAETKETAVSLVKLEGLYQRGKGRTNPDEAKAVVREIVDRLKDPALSELSIGVVTLNSEQQRLIDDMLDQARRDDPDLERFFSDDANEPVFVKNLETVQGDQRDVIFLSIAYGPDTPGAKTMSMNFGPLNRKGGERRLNVAITRATTEVRIFASFDPSMIDLTRTSAAAVRDLKHYLEFAERGPAALGAALQSVGGVDHYDSDFEEAVAEGLRKKDWSIHTQIGVSKFRIDLGVVHPDHPGRYLAGIECDGATYHSSPSARDRDRVRHAVLENLNWKLLRIWSTDFFIDPAGTLERIDEQLQELLEAERAKAAAEDEEKAEVAPDVEAASAGVSGEKEDEESIEAEYASQQPAVDDEGVCREERGTSVDDEPETEIGQRLPAGTLPKHGHIGHQVFARRISGENEPGEGELEISGDHFYELDYLTTLSTLALRQIDDLGPMTFQHLATRLARAHGFQRTGSQIKKQVWAAVGKKRASTRTPDNRTVFWPSDDEPEEVVEFRGLNVRGDERAWGDVPYPEKLGLAWAILKEGPHADASAAMAVRIGLGRLTRKTREELEDLLGTAEQIE